MILFGKYQLKFLSYFNFWGFLFGWMWLIKRELWAVGFLFMLFQLPLFFLVVAIGSYLDTNTVTLNNLYLLIPWLLLILSNVYIGLKANEWLENKSRKKSKNSAYEN